MVEPAAEGLKELIRSSLTEFSSLTAQEQKEAYGEYSDQGFPGVIAYIYEYFAEFKLLITGSPGTVCQDFLESLVKLDTECMKAFLKAWAAAHGRRAGLRKDSCMWFRVRFILVFSRWSFMI